jgi:hypothetical protein
MVQRAVKLYSERTSHDLAHVPQRLANSKIQDLTRFSMFEFWSLPFSYWRLGLFSRQDAE